MIKIWWKCSRRTIWEIDISYVYKILRFHISNVYIDIEDRYTPKNISAIDLFQNIGRFFLCTRMESDTCQNSIRCHLIILHQKKFKSNLSYIHFYSMRGIYYIGEIKEGNHKLDPSLVVLVVVVVVLVVVTTSTYYKDL